MKKKAILFPLILFICFGFGIWVALILESQDVVGLQNATVTTKVNVTNVFPTIDSITISPASIDLNPGNTTRVNCTGIINDSNGWQDIRRVNATLYDFNYGPDGNNYDNNFRYFNGTCNSSCVPLTSTSVRCTCQFDVWYYANNGSWQCNMTASDAYGLKVNNISNNATINSLIAISAPSELNFGNLSVTETSSLKTLNLTNYGNININISLRGYGGTDETILNAGNYSLMCETGNISNTYERYSVSNSTVYAAMLNVTNVSTSIDNFKLPFRTNDTAIGNSTNSTYWRLQIPSDVGGFCNGTLIFYAMETTYP